MAWPWVTTRCTCLVVLRQAFRGNLFFKNKMSVVVDDVMEFLKRTFLRFLPKSPAGGLVLTHLSLYLRWARRPRALSSNSHEDTK